jgi:hypothetical protein
MDEKVIDYRWIFRALLVQGIILKPDLQNLQKLIKRYGQMKALHLL